MTTLLPQQTLVPKSRKGRPIRRIFQHPNKFNSFECFCKHVGESWSINVIELCSQPVLLSIPNADDTTDASSSTLPNQNSTTHNDDSLTTTPSSNVHPAAAAATIAFTCPYLSEIDLRGFLTDIYDDVLSTWDFFPHEEQRYYLWCMFDTIIELYFTPDVIDTDILENIRAVIQYPRVQIGNQ